MFIGQVIGNATKTLKHMKNTIIIRLENTMFNTKHITSHLQKAKDKNEYVNTSLPKCKMNSDMIDIIDFISKVKSMGKKIQVKIITQFKSDVVWKLLRNNNLTWCQICNSIENASKDQEKSTMIVYSTNEYDKQYAIQNEIAIANEISINEMGVRKAPTKMAA